MKKSVLSLVMMVACGWAFAQENASNKTTVTADTISFDYKRRMAELQNHVVMVDPQIKMEADKVVAFFDESNQVKSVTATGNVKIYYQDKTATARKAIYTAKESKIMLLGDAIIKRGSEYIKGNEIAYWFIQERIVVKPGTMVFDAQNQSGTFEGLDLKGKKDGN